MPDQMRYCFLASLMIVLALASAVQISAATVGAASILAPAVMEANSTGTLTLINLTVTTGTGNVSVQGPLAVGNSTLASAFAASRYAGAYLGLDFNSYNFVYHISDVGANVSGPSGGAAMALLAISAMSHQHIRPNFTMTGTISGSGAVGEVGGVYDKASAAAAAGLGFMLVPATPANSREAQIYLLIQDRLGLPLVQVSDISGAAHYAFNSSADAGANATSVNLYTDYNTDEIPAANLTCSNNCDMSLFNKMVNSTLRDTAAQISELNATPGFGNVAAQLNSLLNESATLIRMNYLYAGANFAFLDYMNAFFFNAHISNESSALSALSNAQSYCGSLTPPPMTYDNYDYLLGAELRQGWANFTLNQTLSSYASGTMDSDSYLASSFGIAESTGWCLTANTIYSAEAAQRTSASDLAEPSQSLASVALARINGAEAYPGMYLSSAQLAYKQGNYPLAILDADYAYALSGAASDAGNMSTEQLISASGALVANSTYGVWSTEFAKSALFYVNESLISTSNASLAHMYALQAYSTAVLAQQLSADTALIYRNLVPATGTNVQIAQLVDKVNQLDVIVIALATLIAASIVLEVIIIAVLLKRRVTAPLRVTRRRRRR